MESIVTALQMAGIVVVGLLVRLGIMLIAVAVLMVPVSIGLAVTFGYQALRRHGFGPGVARTVAETARTHYGPAHTWARSIAPSRIRVGLDHVALRLLAGARRVELPSPGTVLRAGEVAGAITCGDRRAEFRSPVSGVVSTVNDALASDPSLITRDPYASGWLYAVAPSDTGFNGLRRGRSARAWLDAEAARLTRLLDGHLAVAAADGGEPIASALLDDGQWTVLEREFLGAGGS